jgi:hypothetical protein
MAKARPPPSGVEDHAPRVKPPERQPPGDDVESQHPFRHTPETD